jgi:thiamine transport system substrate-binding protein
MNHSNLITKILALLLALALAACAGASEGPTPTAPGGAPAPTAQEATGAAGGEGQTLRVMTHDSFAASEEVIAAFQAENNVTVQFIQAGDTGAALNKAILSKDNPLADVFYGVDNTYLSRALEEDLFEPYESPLLAQIPDEYKLDPQNRALPVDYGDVCLNYDKRYFAEKGLEPPQNLEDLREPAYKDLLVVENPASSSPGLAFLLATIGHFGEEAYLDYWQGLRANGVKVVNDWETAYNGEFSAGPGGGVYPIVVSYGSSPPFEVLYADPPVEEPSTAVVTSEGACFRQIEFVGILKGGANRALAEKWVDFMLSTAFQGDLPLQMFVFPVNPEAELDPIFEKFLALPEKPAYVSPADIAANREKWIQAWTETVLR